MEKEVENRFVVKIGDNILSPLGSSTEENFNSVLKGESALCFHENLWGLPEGFVASLFDRSTISAKNQEYFSFFEQICILSAQKAIDNSGINPGDNRTVFILSTTKGNVSLLNSENSYREEILLSVSAQKIASYFQNPNTPIVVSNACTSGLCAQIAAQRALYSGRFDNAVVIGADEQSKFIVSGFQSFKALSPEACRPFDKNRKGLNLGEAAATVVYQIRGEVSHNDWVLFAGAIRNDANHISGPSRTAEGSFRALKAVVDDPAQLAFICAHGTATAYNDEMEAIAISRCALTNIPVFSLKGYFGHTMGTAGVLETLLSMKAVENQCVIGTRGYAENGTSVSELRVNSQHTETKKRSFVKMLSGFGGCNAVAVFKQGGGLC